MPDTENEEALVGDRMPVSEHWAQTWPKAIRGGKGMALNIDIESPGPYRPDERVVALRTVGMKGGERARVAFRAEELRTLIEWLEQAHAVLEEHANAR